MAVACPTLWPAYAQVQDEAELTSSESVECPQLPLSIRSPATWSGQCAVELLCSRPAPARTIDAACQRITVTFDDPLTARMICEQGGHTTERQLSAPHCEALLQDVGLAVDLWLFEDTLLGDTLVEDPAVPPTVSDASTQSQSNSGPLNTEPVEDPVTAPANDPITVSNPHATLAAGIRSTWGLVPAVGLGIFVTPSLRWADVSLGIDVLYDSSPGTVALRSAPFWVSSLRVGPSIGYSWRSLEIMAFVHGGSFWALYSPTDQLQSTWSADVGLRLQFGLDFANWISGIAAIEFALPLMRVDLVQTSEVVFTSEPVLIALQLGCRLQ